MPNIKVNNTVLKSNGLGLNIIQAKILNKVLSIREEIIVEKLFLSQRNFLFVIFVFLLSFLLKNNIKTRRNNSIFPLQSLTNILKNTIYIGFKDMRITDFHYRFECPLIVEEDLFHKVQLRMKEILERKNQINRTQHEYLIRDYLYCNECKNGMSGIWREKLNQTKQ